MILLSLNSLDFGYFSYDHSKMKKREQNIQELGRLIKTQRNQMKLSQTQMAELAGVSLNLISQIELGKPRVQFIKLIQVLQTLGLQLKIELGPAGLVIAKNLLDK
jgi:y4mF family transcriptional regulator